MKRKVTKISILFDDNFEVRFIPEKREDDKFTYTVLIYHNDIQMASVFRTTRFANKSNAEYFLAGYTNEKA